jgi:hypothetical protein
MGLLAHDLLLILLILLQLGLIYQLLVHELNLLLHLIILHLYGLVVWLTVRTTVHLHRSNGSRVATSIWLLLQMWNVAAIYQVRMFRSWRRVVILHVPHAWLMRILVWVELGVLHFYLEE